MSVICDIEKTLRGQVRELSTSKLRAAFEWHTALVEHADDNCRHVEYHREKLILSIVRDELERRRSEGQG